MKKIVFFISSLLLILAILCVIKSSGLKSLQTAALTVNGNQAVSDDVINKLSEAIKIRTISNEDKSQFQEREFLNIIDFLRSSFPLSAEKLNPQVINKYSLLYTWTGSDPSLKPALMMAHLDVVPVEPGTEKDWKYGAYDGTVAEGYIWGRGALDDKVNVVTILEAAEILLKQNFQPKRTIYFAFGHDEEVNGEQGALKIAELLKSKNIKLDSVMDEGMFILDGQLPGIKAPVAFIGAAEKGYLDVEFVVKSKGGHSSQPPAESPAGILSKAILILEKNPFPASTKGVVDSMFDFAAPEMGGLLKVIFSNRWLFSPLVKSQLSGSPTTNALIRTTSVTTMLSGSQKSNVMPAQARAVANFRILPGETIDGVLAKVRKIVSDERVEINKLPGGNEAVSVSDLNSQSFKDIQSAIRSNFPEVVVVPSLMIGGTDSKHFAGISDNIYRFSPMHLSEEDLAGFHGTNEKIGTENLKKIVSYYVTLIQLK